MSRARVPPSPFAVFGLMGLSGSAFALLPSVWPALALSALYGLTHAPPRCLPSSQPRCSRCRLLRCAR